MNYGGTGSKNCFHCGKSGSTHAIPHISSDDATIKLARGLQALLDGAYANGVSRGYVLPVGSVMVGAVIATVGSAVVKAVALSGANANAMLNILKTGALGKDVAYVGDVVAPESCISLLKLPLRKKALLIQSAVSGTPLAGAPTIAEPKYHVGSCAGPKLLNYVLQKTNPSAGKRISRIAMAEIFWKSGGKSKWSTGTVVESCQTCAHLLPMMLCNYNEDGEKVPYRA